MLVVEEPTIWFPPLLSWSWGGGVGGGLWGQGGGIHGRDCGPLKVQVDILDTGKYMVFCRNNTVGP